MLDLFWKSHNPFGPPRSSQYMSALFWRDAHQRQSAEQAVDRLQREGGRAVTTKLLPFEAFYLAEDYHQKYVLRRHREFAVPLAEVYPDPVAFTHSTAAARLNGFLAGYGSRDAVEQELPLLGLDAEAQGRLLALRR